MAKTTASAMAKLVRMRAFIDDGCDMSGFLLERLGFGMGQLDSQTL
jgi:hypothetical protein